MYIKPCKMRVSAQAIWMSGSREVPGVQKGSKVQGDGKKV